MIATQDPDQLLPRWLSSPRARHLKPPITRMKRFNFVGAGKRRRGRAGVTSETWGFDRSVRLLLFLLLSPAVMPTCHAARGDSCTTEIPKLVQNNPGITKIDRNTCSEGKKNDVMLLPSHILWVWWNVRRRPYAKENSSERKISISQPPTTDCSSKTCFLTPPPPRPPRAHFHDRRAAAGDRQPAAQRPLCGAPRDARSRHRPQ